MVCNSVTNDCRRFLCRDQSKFWLDQTSVLPTGSHYKTQCFSVTPSFNSFFSRWALQINSWTCPWPPSWPSTASWSRALLKSNISAIATRLFNFSFDRIKSGPICHVNHCDRDPSSDFVKVARSYMYFRVRRQSCRSPMLPSPPSSRYCRLKFACHAVRKTMKHKALEHWNNTFFLHSTVNWNHL